jgi:hypothetical protein
VATVTVSPVKAPVILAQSGANVAHTGDVLETIICTVAIPANFLGPNGHVDLYAVYSRANGGAPASANLQTRFGLAGSGLTGTIFQPNSQTVVTTAALSGRALYGFYNDNATNVQESVAAPNLSASVTVALSSGAVDTTQATEFNLTVTLGNAGDTITLSGYTAIGYPM